MHARCYQADPRLAALPTSDEVLVPAGAQPLSLGHITALVGGGATDLDAVPTVNLTADTGEAYFLRIDGQTIPVYFDSGAADPEEPGEIQPLDNPEYHWSRGL